MDGYDVCLTHKCQQKRATADTRSDTLLCVCVSVYDKCEAKVLLDNTTLVPSRMGDVGWWKTRQLTSIHRNFQFKFIFSYQKWLFFYQDLPLFPFTLG